MFISKIFLATVLMSLHAGNSYILLTANLDDMHSLAKQIAESPVANQINDIIRRAANIIKETAEHSKNSSRKAHMRSAYHQSDQEQPETDVRQPQTNEGKPQTNGDQDTVEKTDQNQQEKNQPEIEKTDKNQPEIEKTDQNQPEIEKTDQNQPEKEKADQNPAEGKKVAGNTDTAPENENQNIEVWKPDQKALAAELKSKASDSSSELSEETNGKKPRHSSRRDVSFVELGRNASYYLNSIKQIFENI